MRGVSAPFRHVKEEMVRTIQALTTPVTAVNTLHKGCWGGEALLCHADPGQSSRRGR